MAESSTVVSGEDATPDQYNDLRKDVRDPALGHDHEGTEGKILDGGVALAAGTITEDRLATALADKINNAMPKMQTKKTTLTTDSSVGLQTILNVTSKSGVLIAVFAEDGSTSTMRIKVTIDGVVIADATATSNVSLALNAEGFVALGGTVDGAGFKTSQDSTYLGWNFKTSCLVEVDGGSTIKSFRTIHAEE